MKIIREITYREMLRRFAIGETYSNFYNPPNNEYREESLRLLKSGEQIKENEGIKRVLMGREPLIKSFPQDTKWYLAVLPITIDFFSAIKTINDSGWVGHSGGSQKLIDAAINLRDKTRNDARVDAIVSAFKQGKVEMQGITLVAESKKGPFTVAEGNGRLVAVYLCCIDGKNDSICENEIEFVLGTTTSRWCFS
jgi:hypothetical protein